MVWVDTDPPAPGGNRIRMSRAVEKESLIANWRISCVSPSHIEMDSGLEVKRLVLRGSFLVGGLEEARGCGYGDCFGDIRWDVNFFRRSDLSQTSNQATPSQAIPNQKAHAAPPLEGTDIIKYINRHVEQTPSQAEKGKQRKPSRERQAKEAEQRKASKESRAEKGKQRKPSRERQAKKAEQRKASKGSRAEKGKQRKPSRERLRNYVISCARCY
ncbi:hypothetical protein TNCV_3249851 [Trichonephila clavipes]|nr:hypothetical protein TNCV_3249851 [Trichonephila clavipes]